ncbi:Vacuolar protein sorting-associated protein 37B [Oopsacas minuta]|uniref:Vacuolar protein sorting-associated protein 37B n=1 Tax=Oopsacas minuta TaxID=111878 RepID=A0AAV7K506_9METZ|nr:Vacuolar protein sorting-associated protein 37B [Oopsacas minuta]
MSSVDKVNQLTTQELEEMMNTSDESTFHLFLNEDQGVKRLKGERENIEKDTLLVARETLSLENKFNSDRERLIESCQTYAALKNEFESQLGTLKTILSGTSSEEVLQQLRKLSEQKEDQSEEVTEMFLSGKCSTEQFLKDFIDKRRDSHIFRVKSEHLSKVIRKDQTGRPRTAGFSPNPPIFPAPHPPPYQNSPVAPQW